jgi:hypothetical protein
VVLGACKPCSFQYAQYWKQESQRVCAKEPSLCLAVPLGNEPLSTDNGAAQKVSVSLFFSSALQQ